LDDRPRLYDPAQKPIAGVFVTLAADGQLQVEPGFVRPEDEPCAEIGNGIDGGEGEEGDAPCSADDNP
ncbi:hypothetical protein, partial [Mesorhizobium sp.]|uniref:hypothetical protein n=1 Tax=Mesorhizobium sp. TaxID=1871066 RepID=UPI00344D0EFD